MSPFARIAALPRLPLAVTPSPLTPAPRLAEAIGAAALWLKRDDLLGFGHGGNKVRGLELLVAEALAIRADVLVTGAGPQSNHVRATAAAAAVAGLELAALYWGDEPPVASGNLALVRLLGARASFTGERDRESVDRAIAATCAALAAEGRRPFAIPRGGACELGVLAHALAARELDAQCRATGIEPGLVLLAVGSGATLAGWLLGTRLAGARWRVEGVTVSRPAAEAAARVRELGAAAARRVGVTPFDGEVVVHDGYIGDGYGVPTARGAAAIQLAARRAGVFLDPTYTGKAFAALGDLARGAGTVVFVHTGGEPGRFA